MHVEVGDFGQEEERRRVGAASPFFVSLGGEEAEKKGMQDKGTASHTRLSDCLHIVFVRDRVSHEGDTPRPAQLGPSLT